MFNKCGLKADLSNYKSLKSKYNFDSVCPQTAHDNAHKRTGQQYT